MLFSIFSMRPLQSFVMIKSFSCKPDAISGNFFLDNVWRRTVCLSFRRTPKMRSAEFCGC